MDTVFVEASNGGNWGKFMVGEFDREDWSYVSQMEGAERYRLLAARGWGRDTVHVLDLETGEGALFHPTVAGRAQFDLNKKRIWVCPLFEPFLDWLYGFIKERGADWLMQLPAVVELPDAPFSLYGYRRAGLGPTEGDRGDGTQGE